MQVLIWFGYPLVFVDAGEIFVMVDDVATPLNPPIAPVEQEELEEMLFDVNVFQRPRKKEPSRRVVCTRVDCSAWDRQLSPKPTCLSNLFRMCSCSRSRARKV
jgi:hypothetical protein